MSLATEVSEVQSGLLREVVIANLAHCHCFSIKFVRPWGGPEAPSRCQHCPAPKGTLFCNSVIQKNSDKTHVALCGGRVKDETEEKISREGEAHIGGVQTY